MKAQTNVYTALIKRKKKGRRRNDMANLHTREIRYCNLGCCKKVQSVIVRACVSRAPICVQICAVYYKHTNRIYYDQQ